MQRFRKACAGVLLFSGIVFAPGIFAKEREVTLALKDLPGPVQKTLESLKPGVAPDKIEKEEEGGYVFYEAAYKQGDAENEIKMDDKGRVVEMETEIAASELPSPISEQIAARYPDHTIKEAEQVTASYYEVEVKVEGEEWVVRILHNGLVLGSESEDEDEEDAGEETVEWTGLPGPVQKAFEAYRESSKPDKVVQVTEDGFVSFEAKYSKEGTIAHEVMVDESGQIMEIEDELPMANLPLETKESLAKAFPKASIEEVTWKQAISYSIEIAKEEEKTEAKFLSNGLFLEDAESD